MRKNISGARALRVVVPALLLVCATLFGYAMINATRRAAPNQTEKAAPKTQREGAQQKGAGAAASKGDGHEVTPDNRNFNPRGRIAFASDRDGNFEIYVMNPDGSGQLRLTNDPGEDTQPAWSPDGTQIAFVSNRAGTNDIYIMNADGSGLHRLINSPGNEQSPAWAPNIDMIAFTSDVTGNDEIYLIDTGGEDKPLPPGRSTSDNPADDIEPAWSPNGALIAFASNRDGNYEIYTMNTLGGNQTRLTNSPDADTHPSWSVNQITFESERDGNSEIYTMNPDGSGQTNLTNNPAFDTTPARAFEGSRIVFASNRDGNLELYAANPAGQNVTRLTNNTEATDFQPSVQRLSVPANSTAKLFIAMLDGAQEVPPTNSTGRGIGTLLLSGDETTARISLTFAGLSSAETAAHIHGPAAPGATAAVLFPLPLGAFSDFQITLTPVQVQQLKSGLFYMNIHTTNFAGGEIRGQLNAAPQSTTDLASPVNIYALTVGNRLLTFNSSMPSMIVNNVAITGLQAGEILRGIDIRPANGQLYGVGSTSRLYTINPQTGAATQVGSAPFTPALSGTEFGFDFNPTVDRIRLVSDTGQNLRLNPDTGAVAATDTSLNFSMDSPFTGTPHVSGAAYTNNFAGATTTTLYDIDYALDLLFTQNPPNNGTLNAVGALGVDTGKLVGFDIASNNGGSNAAFASLTGANDAGSRLYAIDLTNGAATLLGDINTTELVRDIAVGAITTAGFTQSSFVVDEGAGKLQLDVTRTGDLSGAATIDYDTNDGTATERKDYSTAAGTLRFAPGEATKTITVFITDDKFVEPDETFTITLSNPVGASFNPQTTVTVTIKDNDSAQPTSNPIDDTPFFVRQQYIDFLGREPDTAGFNAWVNVLNNCPNRINDPTCDRVTVSAAFFRSPEFQLKGAFAIRFYLAALGRLPTYREFVGDLADLNGATPAEVNANIAAFADRFLQRETVRTALDPLSNAAFVDKLIANAGVQIANRDQLVADLNAGVQTRAQVLRLIVDNQAFTQATTNKAFVLAEYFGYLRRDPDTSGFNAWLAYLNANPTDFRTMVRGFADSIEYRARFGPQ